MRICTKGGGDTREGGADEPERHLVQHPDRHGFKYRCNLQRWFLPRGFQTFFLCLASRNKEYDVIPVKRMKDKNDLK